jgi:hypothetical protein
MNTLNCNLKAYKKCDRENLNGDDDDDEGREN